MPPSLVLLNILAATALLLWGLSHLKNGMLKGFGGPLRRMISHGTSHPLKALASGVLATLCLQSSTATILTTAGFASQGLVGSTAALAITLGADLGTALVAAILSMKLTWLMPLLILVGYILYRQRQKSRIHNLGRILSGLGLMLLSLQWIRESTAPLAESEILPVILQPLLQDPIFAIILGAVLTWVIHSSLAMILITAVMVQEEVFGLNYALYLVLGANLGGTFPALLMLWYDHPRAARLALGNTLMRFSGLILALPALSFLTPLLYDAHQNGMNGVIAFHIIFNLGLALIALPFLKPITELTKQIKPDRNDPDDPSQARFLNDNELDTPAIALGNASRETLRMAELLQEMMNEALDAFDTHDVQLVKTVREQDETIDRLYSQIKHYIASLLSREELDEEEAERAVHILTFATNVEHAGDVIDKNLMPLAEKKIRKSQNFSERGFTEIKEFHGFVLTSVIQAQQVFMTRDEQLARKMIATKRGPIRSAETAATQAHLERLSDGVPETIATTSLHLDIMRDLRRINTYMCAVAYDVVGE